MQELMHAFYILNCLFSILSSLFNKKDVSDIKFILSSLFSQCKCSFCHQTFQCFCFYGENLA